VKIGLYAAVYLNLDPVTNPIKKEKCERELKSHRTFSHRPNSKNGNKLIKRTAQCSIWRMKPTHESGELQNQNQTTPPPFYHWKSCRMKDSYPQNDVASQISQSRKFKQL